MDTSTIAWFLQIDAHLGQFFQNYGFWAYGILFLVIFAETGFVVLPFLPGDTLLFASGALAASNGPDLLILLIVISVAAIGGNTTNFWIGWGVSRAASGEHILHRIIKPHHLVSAHAFFAKWGPWAITLCRFFPILRTITPFVAGLGRMNFATFTFYNVIGSIAWSVCFVLLGYFFGNMPIVKDNFLVLVIFILFISTVPFLIAILKARLGRKKKPE